ncbi:MAG: cytochrome b/b6 domain-containing protein [Lentimicrobium sp.]|jgi:thiosulfate reductase cytochrome b subunit|nr:cytochrome b/b6 domain-containing protein [Lentimicrobium sp.]
MKRVYLYPVWLRFWHVLNALVMIVLILTGVSMQYSSREFSLIRFDIAVKLHNISGISLTVLFLVFLFGVLFTWAGKFYWMEYKGFWKRMYLQFRYYVYGIFRGETAPIPVSEDRKFNPIQHLSYNLIQFIAVPLVIITGWALLFPETIILNVFGYSGILLTSLLHVIMGFVISIFLLIHLYFITFGHTLTSSMKSMLNGYHSVPDEHDKEVPKE